jgi:nucleoside diphosphate kinase
MESTQTNSKFLRTLDAKPNDASIVKPGELVDIIEMTPLTLTDRRIYNLLLANAWDKIAEPVQHVIPKRELQSTLHKGTDRLEDSIRRLMSAIVQLRVLDGKQWVTKRVQLLGGNVVPDGDDGVIRYDFQPLMREIVAESRVFARLHKQIMFALSSKYSLALYEMIQKRGNMTRTFEEMSIDEFRSFLGVPVGKLGTWINFKNFAIVPAVREVSDLSDFKVTVEPVKGKGKQFTGVRLAWERKALPELREVERELSYSKVGRKARLAGTVEAMEFGGASVGSEMTSPTPPLPLILKSDTLGKARKLCPGYDIYALENEWRMWAAGKPRPGNADAAFIAFAKTYVKNHPLN